MINFAKTTTVVALALLCAGCGTYSLFDSKRVDYRGASKLPPLEVPPDLTKPKPEDRFSVPDNKPVSAREYDLQQAGQTQVKNSDVLPQVDKVHLERAGSQRWLVVPGTPDKLYGEVKEFWVETGFIIKLEIPEAGVMETDWAENRSKIPQSAIRGLVSKVFEGMYSSSERDKFRTRLERGVEPGTTEIYISHRGAEEVYTSPQKDQTAWQPRPSDPELEAEMLGRLMAHFGVETQRAKVLVAEQSKGVERAHIVDRPDGTGMLEVSEPFDRAWRRVGLALDRVGFTVEDRDRNKGLYYVRYVDPEIDQRQAQKGFFSRMFSNADEKKALKYRIEVKDAKEQSQVEVQSNDGVADKSPAAKKILALLQDQLK
jgi:outer membrane protein assembly factor BamC